MRRLLLIGGAGLRDPGGAGALAAKLPRGLYFSVLELNYYVREAFALANELFLGVDL